MAVVSDGHKTSSIPRPRDPTRARATATTEGTKHDFTRPIARDKQLVKGRGKRIFIAVGATVITAALVAALFVLPVQAWLRQRDEIDSKQAQLDVLDKANAELAGDVARLETPDGIKEAAREEIGFVERGEVRFTVMPAPAAPLTLPTGWPYDAVGQIIAVRSAPPPTAP